MLYIGEYRDIASTPRGSIPIALEPPSVQQEIETGLHSVQSKPLAPDTCIVRLIAEADCAIAIGPDPDASKSVRRMKAGSELTIAVSPNMKIAAIGTGSGVPSGIDSLEGLLKLVTSPAEVKQQLDVLAAAAAKLEAATEAHREAAGAFEWSGRLGDWETNLRQREQAVAALQADLEARFARLRALNS